MKWNSAKCDLETKGKVDLAKVQIDVEKAESQFGKGNDTVEA
jgi:hypothetical protein